MSFLRKVAAVTWKDLRTEWRTREMFSAMFVFALLVVLIFNFALQLRAENVRILVPGILWVAFTFSGMLGLSRSFILEKDRGSLEGLLLAPVDRSAIYLGKMLGNIILMGIMEVFLLPITFVLFNLSFGSLPVLVLIVALGTLGFAALGTLFSAMAVNTRAREVMLPLLLLPVAVPLVIAAVKLTAGVMDQTAMAELSRWWQFLIGFDAIFLTVALITFDYVIEE
jgi:heme exporter protein B